MPSKILFNDFRRQWEDIRGAMLSTFEAVGESGWYILGRGVREFEAELARLFGVAHAVGVASGLDALEISLRVLGCQPGDKVLTTPISAFATTLAILRIDAVPVFADVNSYGLLDLDACQDILRKRPDLRFVVPVHLYGHSLDLSRLRELRKQYGVRIVEDCAQSIAARNRGESTGTAGDLAITSFYPTKNLGAMGDGGAILANDAAMASTAAQYRDYGQTAKYRHEFIGYNSRLDELQAALLCRVGLPKLPQWTAQRRAIACHYASGLADTSICSPGAPAHSESVWHLYPVLVHPDRKGDFIDYLKANGIAAAEHYPTAICDQPAMKSVQHEIIGDPSKARLFCRSEVSLPIHPYMSDDEAAHVVTICRQWGK